MLERIDATTAKIDQVTAQINRVIAPFAGHAQRLDEITGVGVVAAQELIAEIGVQMAASPPQGTWSPGPSSPPATPVRRQVQGGHHRQGQPLAGRHPGRDRRRSRAHRHLPLGERYRRLARRRGKQRAIVAVGNSVLTIVWHLLADPQAHDHDLGPDFY